MLSLAFVVLNCGLLNWRREQSACVDIGSGGGTCGKHKHVDGVAILAEPSSVVEVKRIEEDRSGGIKDLW